ncbi:MAG TPA: toxin [Casimicrobiaceae bacterium]|nr:toxin [Casimicrobiaceae bacterium]
MTLDRLSRQRLDRIVVIGSSCAGKTTFARTLAALFECPAIQLDELYWGPNWNARSPDEFAKLTDAATSGHRWVVDGNYSVIRDLVWPRATAIVWLNIGFCTVLVRALRRTLMRSATGQLLYAGNRESPRRAFFSRDSILLWVVTTYHDRRRRFSALRANSTYPAAEWVELRNAGDAAAFLRSVRSRLTH